jgi:hypothetical protein
MGYIQTFNPLSGNFDSVLDTDSPAFTGTPTVPTQTAGDNSTKIASTAYVDSASGKDVVIPALNIDWSSGTTFYKSINANSTFTFSNVIAGKTITVVVFNSNGNAVDIVLPTVRVQANAFDTSILSNRANVYVFTSINGAVYASSIIEVS